MKNQLILAGAALSVFCCLYVVRLSDAAKAAFPAAQETPFVVPAVYESESAPVPQPLPEAEVKLNATKTTAKISNESEAYVECKKGTKLFFPAGSFIYPSGKPVTGKVKLVIEECYDMDEMLKAKLSTTSGNRRLETAGMIKVTAYAGGTEVNLKENGRYNIYFPVSGQRKDDFELFYGYRDENGIIDWKLEDNSVAIDETPASSRSITNDCFVQISASQYRCGNHIKEMDYFNWPLTNGQNLNQWFVSSFNADPAMLDDFCAKRMYSQLTFHLNEDGTVKDYYISHGSRDDYDRLLASTLMTMPPIDMEKFMPKYKEDHACILSFGRQQETNSKQFVNRFKKRHNYTDPDKKLADVKTEDLNYYVFSSTELGWINCDRFLPTEGPLVNVTVNVPMCEGPSVSMVFDDNRCILAGVKQDGRFVFNNVPSNTNVRLIVLDNPEGRPRMEEAKMNTSALRYTVSDMEPITLADLDRALCWN
jgi:hypothetical protein